jgi:hypothetical protein
MAQMMRVGLYRPVHEKTLRSQRLRVLLTRRQLLLSKAIAIGNDLRTTLRNFGLKIGMVGKVKFETRIEELVENQPDLASWSLCGGEFITLFIGVAAWVVYGTRARVAKGYRRPGRHVLWCTPRRRSPLYSKG